MTSRISSVSGYQGASVGVRGGGEGRSPLGPPGTGPRKGGGSRAAAAGRGMGRRPRRRVLPANSRSAGGKARPGPACPGSVVGGGSLAGGARLLPFLLPPVPPSSARPRSGPGRTGGDFHRPGTAGGGGREERVLCAPGVFSCGFPSASSQDLNPRVAARRAVTAWIVRGSCVDHTSSWDRGAAQARGSTRPVPACLREGGSVEFKRIKLSEVIYPVS